MKVMWGYRGYPRGHDPSAHQRPPYAFPRDIPKKSPLTVINSRGPTATALLAAAVQPSYILHQTKFTKASLINKKYKFIRSSIDE